MLGAYIAAVSETVLDIHGQDTVKFAAIFLTYSHFSVPDCDAGLKAQKIGSERLKRRATSALVEELKAVDDKRRVNARHKLLARMRYLCGSPALLCHLTRADNQQSSAC